MERCRSVNHAPRILFFQRSVPPDHSAAGLLLFDLARDLARRGWEVWIAGTRTSPDVAPEEICDGVHFCRGLVPPVNKTSLRSRFLALPGTWLAMLSALRRCPRPDILVTLTDPPLSVCAGALAARIFRCRHVHWCQDLYPQVAAAAGVIRGDGILCRFLNRLVRAALRDCDRTVVVGRCMQDRLGDFSTTLIPNWARTIPLSTPPPDSRFRVLYSGNLGRAHDFDGLTAAAQITAAKPLVWTVCGDGPQSSAVSAPVERMPSVAWKDFPALLASAHAHLITLREEFCGLVVPSKLYDCAASGRPILFAGPADSECARAILENRMGLVVPDRQGPALAAAAESLAGNPDLCREMSRAALHFSDRHRLADSSTRFEALLRALIDPDQAKI